MRVFFSTILATEKNEFGFQYYKIPNYQKISPNLIINLSIIILIQRKFIKQTKYCVYWFSISMRNLGWNKIEIKGKFKQNVRVDGIRNLFSKNLDSKIIQS